jgi:hypothetical protein
MSDSITGTIQTIMSIQTPLDAYTHARTVLRGRWPEIELIIMTDPSLAYLYAKYVITGRWPEAEPVIATDAISACEY